MSPPRPPRAELLVMGRHLRNRWGGVYEVLSGLLAALDPLAEQHERPIRLLLPEEGIPLPDYRAIRPVVLSRWGRSRLLWDHWTVPRYANSRSNAVLYNPGIVIPAGMRLPSIVSIHDLLYFPRPELEGAAEYLPGDAWYMRRMIRRSLAGAAAVLVPSESTRREAQRLFPGDEASRIRVLPYGVDLNRWGAPEPSDELPMNLVRRGVKEPYLLYAGGLSRRKNVGMLLEAFAVYRARHPEVSLVLTGGEKRTQVEPALLTALEVGERSGGVVQLGEIDQTVLKALYARADALIYPSRYEGFGLPPLEAQAAGCPVICSSATSLPEVVGESALMFDPASSEALTTAMERLREEGAREALIQRGRENAARSTWNRMALGLLDLVDEIQISSPSFLV